MSETALIIITALCSGLIATFVTIWWQRKNQQRAEKVQIFTVLMSKRYDIAAEENVEALNMIDIVFYSSKKVRMAWKEFIDATSLPESQSKAQTISDKHLRLLEVIAEDIGYKGIRWEDIKHYYYPKGLSEKQQQEAILRKVQIDAGIAQINKVKEQGSTSQVDAQTQLNNQMLLKAMENPDALLKLFEVAEKAQNLTKGGSMSRK